MTINKLFENIIYLNKVKYKGGNKFKTIQGLLKLDATTHNINKIKDMVNQLKEKEWKKK